MVFPEKLIKEYVNAKNHLPPINADERR